MPNHCSNQVTLRSSSVDILNIMEFLANEDTLLDFNQLVPMPEELNDVQYLDSGGTTYYYSATKWHSSADCNLDKKPFDFPRLEWVQKHGLDSFTIKRLERQYGTAKWYDWCVQNWGTKWNAYEVDYKLTAVDELRNEITYTFFTAWMEPRPIMRALMVYLSQPGFDKDLEMRWRFVDEDDNFNGEVTRDDEV